MIDILPPIPSMGRTVYLPYMDGWFLWFSCIGKYTNQSHGWVLGLPAILLVFGDFQPPAKRIPPKCPWCRFRNYIEICPQKKLFDASHFFTGLLKLKTRRFARKVKINHKLLIPNGRFSDWWVPMQSKITMVQEGDPSNTKTCASFFVPSGHLRTLYFNIICLNPRARRNMHWAPNKCRSFFPDTVVTNNKDAKDTAGWLEKNPQLWKAIRKEKGVFLVDVVLGGWQHLDGPDLTGSFNSNDARSGCEGGWLWWSDFDEVGAGDVLGKCCRFQRFEMF